MKGAASRTICGEAAIVFASCLPEHIILLSRDINKSEDVIREIERISTTSKVFFVRCDLAGHRSVRMAATAIWTLVSHNDILVNNAAFPPCPFLKGGDGIEMQFFANHIRHFLTAGPGTCVIVVSSSSLFLQGSQLLKRSGV